MEKFLVIDVGGTGIKYAIMDEKGNFLSEGQTPTPKESLDVFLETLDTVVLPVKDEVAGIAMSMPGKIDNKTGYMYTGGALSYIHNIALGEILNERYHLPVTIENDAKCAANAEMWLGNLANVNSGMVIILGTGIGGGIVIDRKVWRGFKGSAGEISNLPTQYKDLYGKGNSWASINGYQGLTRPFEAKKGLEKGSVNGKVFFEAYHNGDEDAKVVFDEFIATLTAGIVSLQTVLDVEKYCIGGGISAQNVLIEATQKAIDEYFERSPYTPLNKPQIDRCKFLNGANLVGALNNFFTNANR
mgnify:FL=1